MGCKKLERPNTDRLFSTVSSSLYGRSFEIWDAHKYPDRRTIEMREKERVIPSEQSSFDDAVFDDYTNPVETLNHFERNLEPSNFSDE
ncbi:MAG: hypothetical protein LBH60_01815 [Prevotellaceae bacterium]|jgi:hypothetical protein|nr:hypothetical protein [Prevotellaceae bacterium]